MRDIGRKYTPLHSMPPLGGPRQNIAIPFGVGKLEWRGYRQWKNFENMYNRLDSIPACNRQMDGQTSCDGIDRAMHMRRSVKTVFLTSHLAGTSKRSTTTAEWQHINQWKLLIHAKLNLMKLKPGSSCVLRHPASKQIAPRPIL